MEPGNLDQAWIDLFFRYISTQPRGGTVPETFPGGSGWIKPWVKSVAMHRMLCHEFNVDMYFEQDFLTTLRFGMYLPQEEREWENMKMGVYHMLCLHTD